MLALTFANLKMMVRNFHNTFWALFFPLLLVVVFGLFSNYGGSRVTLAIVDQANNPASRSLVQRVSAVEYLTARESNDLNAEEARLTQGQIDYLLVIPAGFGETVQAEPQLSYKNDQPKRNQLVSTALSNLVDQSRSTESSIHSLVSTEIQALHVSFFDVALLGLIGLGIMTHSIISIAVKISTYRKQSVLKRILVTPLGIWKYFAAEILAHLALALVQAAIILAVGVYLFGAQVNGNLAWIFVIVVLGSIIFLNMGFIISAWANTPSAASGMGNAIALPMVFLAGAFFSTNSLPWILPYAVQALPLTPMISAMSQVSIYSAQIWQVWPQLAVLGGWIAVTSLVAIKVFRFS